MADNNLWGQLTSQWGLPSYFTPDQFRTFGPNPIYSGGGDSGSSLSGYSEPSSGYYGPGYGNSNDYSNFAFQFAPDPYYDSYVKSHLDTSREAQGINNTAPVDWSQFDPSQYKVNPQSVLVKSGKTEGSRFNLVPDANGNLVPTFAGTEYWNTNPDNSMLAKFLISAAAIGGGAYLNQMFGGAAGAETTTGAVAGPTEYVPGTLGSGLYGAVTPPPMAMMDPTLAAMPSVTGAVDASMLGSAGLSTVPSIAGSIGEMAATPSLTGGFASQGLPSFVNFPGEVTPSAGLPPPPTGPATTGTPTGGPTTPTPSPTGTPTGIPNPSGLGNLFNGLSGNDISGLLAALMGVNSNQSSASEFKNFYDTAMGRSNQFFNPLQQSFNDPNAYFNSPEFKALNSIDQNQLLRTDSARGNLSNDMARAAELQKRSYQHLNDYRNSLTQGYNVAQNAANQVAPAWLMGSILKNNQWNPLFNMLGNSGYGNQASSNSGIPGFLENILSGNFGDSYNPVTEGDMTFDPTSGDYWDWNTMDWLGLGG